MARRLRPRRASAGCTRKRNEHTPEPSPLACVCGGRAFVPCRIAPGPRATLPAPASIEVKARPIASFDPRDRSHVRFGALEWRSGLVLTSSFRGFGGLSALRLVPKGEKFISLGDKGSWFTGRIVYS